MLIHRPRRLRHSAHIRNMVREHRLSVDDFIYPLFVDENLVDDSQAIGSMPGIVRHSLNTLKWELEDLQELGVRNLLLFGIPASKDAHASQAHAEEGIVQKTLHQIRKDYADTFYLITDVCNCEYTDHGHCGIIVNQDVDNDQTLDLLSRTALSHARAGADMVAPSDMMDGRIGHMRASLDQAGFQNLPIMAYSAKFASAYYGPFREAADSAPQFGDRRSYQMDPPNGREALREISLDLEEGADIVMVKPGLAYLDLVWQAKQISDVPVALYNVSGEYSMVKAAAEKGWIDEKKIVLETFYSFKRAGADLIISYHSKEVAAWLKDGLV
ncbi:porphobilinogen synthase [bacterium (Candidatus Blackallbacteria) CG17_big_fil_post_rev_8_21_14_2_50_48_46]|uniref:Delta-aminolevulinic acid dehydratase n=1 Tax=bacterium (Candidatus Blackallbacteria) CG17_big_fil_post_rev_8_21_14_2_50_48_46 TaxID=2014261 RepID=A0A2M7FZZ7_9BACT|nr:MAG: porphobilinogen synthase [bacterium (Candidatus Blackallbacteria) CG18_big_fil_WC_8_21_14_2_50_49_26]PIW14883.1 MAG: porphobilinogen synthase [bacterium (Candidatus Blackallbacteria) CG17_big_fil_post_rev_8_21_14_2_50_48_46]PIW44450.1 MAG: porphobilinogen synthase [bacterium (Candidatus Blackallbacteria) CG13_big_fil_rev_8_21_14_2_50_49_14]